MSWVWLSGEKERGNKEGGMNQRSDWEGVIHNHAWSFVCGFEAQLRGGSVLYIWGA